MFASALNATPEDKDKFVATAREFYLEEVYDHPFIGFNPHVCADLGNSNLASKILSFLKSSGKEKQQAILILQDQWKEFIAHLSLYLQSFTAIHEHSKTTDKKTDFISARQRTVIDLQKRLVNLISSAKELKELSHKRNLSGVTGSLKWAHSYITWNAPECITEKNCIEIIKDLEILQKVLHDCNLEEMDAIRKQSITPSNST